MALWFCGFTKHFLEVLSLELWDSGRRGRRGEVGGGRLFFLTLKSTEGVCVCVCVWRSKNHNRSESWRQTVGRTKFGFCSPLSHLWLNFWFTLSYCLWLGISSFLDTLCSPPPPTHTLYLPFMSPYKFRTFGNRELSPLILQVWFNWPFPKMVSFLECLRVSCPKWQKIELGFPSLSITRAPPAFEPITPGCY